jgi:predicted alpha/beta-hydrolase family hydrolase
VACRTALGCGAAGVVALAFPLHPPGKPERSRAAELDVDLPLLVVQGDRDAFGRPAEFAKKIQLVEVAGADHGLKAASFGPAASRVVEWINGLVG